MTLKEKIRQNYLDEDDHAEKQQERFCPTALFLWLEYQSVIWEQHTGLPALGLPSLGTLRVQTPIRHSWVSAQPDWIRSLEVLLLDPDHGLQLWGEDRRAMPTFLLLISSLLFHLSIHWNAFTVHHRPGKLREANIRLWYIKAYTVPCECIHTPSFFSRFAILLPYVYCFKFVRFFLHQSTLHTSYWQNKNRIVTTL